MTVRCETCCYWKSNRPVIGFSSGYGQQPSEFVAKGECRRFPPLMMQTPSGPRAQWPLTLAHHWCGEHGEMQTARALPPVEAADGRSEDPLT